MKEKIARIIKGADVECCDPHLGGWVTEWGVSDCTSALLFILKEEIEKVENPEPLDGNMDEYGGFECCRQAILDLLEGK